jgi:hypothetical protein
MDWKYVEGRCYGLIEGILAFSWWDLGKEINSLVKIDVFRLRFEPDTFRIQARSITVWASLLEKKSWKLIEI